MHWRVAITRVYAFALYQAKQIVRECSAASTRVPAISAVPYCTVLYFFNHFLAVLLLK